MLAVACACCVLNDLIYAKGLVVRRNTIVGDGGTACGNNRSNIGIAAGGTALLAVAYTCSVSNDLIYADGLAVRREEAAAVVAEHQIRAPNVFIDGNNVPWFRPAIAFRHIVSFGNVTGALGELTFVCFGFCPDQSLLLLLLQLTRSKCAVLKVVGVGSHLL